MYQLTTEANFDSAHFLSGYNGKCANIHGHRWRIIAEIEQKTLCTTGQTRGMVIDFGDFKRDLKALADSFDHCLIIEKDSLKKSTFEALKSENFSIVQVPFRPTAEEFAKHFYSCLTKQAYNVKKVTVYETPNNCASYTGEDIINA